jgi:hypothetical protein
VSLDVSTEQALDQDLFLQPKVSWRREMTVGRRHLVEVDLALVTTGGAPAEWPLEEAEEYVYFCVLDGAGFDLWAVHDACVVIHRFGGSYGPAEFVVTPHQGAVNRSLRLTFVNQWGVPVAVRELEVSVPDATGSADTKPSERVDVKVPALAVGGLAGAEGLAEDLTLADQITVDLDVPDDLGEPAVAAGPLATLPAGPEAPDTIPDSGYLDRDDRELEKRADDPRLPASYSRRPASVPRNGERRLAGLSEWYNLAGVRRSPSGSLRLDLVPLFSPGATRGSRVTFTARCAPSDERGTFFAIVAEAATGSKPQAAQLRSLQSAKVPPGIYRVTAELLPGPDHVRFHGLPETPRNEVRRWPEVAASVPRSLPPGTGPIHLIAAIEISGPGDLVAQRIGRVRQLVEYVADEAREFVCYSIISYGPHSINVHNLDYPEVAATTLAWAETADDALSVLARLSRNGAAPIGYPVAAQLECVLTDLERQLTGQEGRPVLVTAGARPAHPSRVDPVSEIIPCRWRNDWRGPMDRMRARYPGIAFGAIHDTDWPDDLWRVLSTSTAPEEFSAAGYAHALGLTESPGQVIPVPMFAG